MAVTLDSLKKTVGKKKVKSMAFAWLADYENMAGDTENALARVDAGLQLYPGDIPGMLVRSKILFQKGDFEECVKECERILEKEPFCLSAQKRMGEAYEQLENIDERNRCYRRVHDMDPLDTFWKEEYEAMPETSDAGMAAAAVAGAAGEAVLDSEFAMPDMGDFNAEAPAESAEPAVEAPAEADAEEKPEDSLFSKSLDMDIESPAETAAPADEVVEEKPKQYASPFSTSAEDDDPFAALSALGGDDNLVDESAMDSLQQSLESAMGEDVSDVSLDQEIPEGEEISGNDVGSAFSSLFGDDDDLDSFGETSETKSASPFAQMDLPTSLDDEPAAPEDSAKNVFGEEAVEDKPQSIDDAFGDIFGEDELPEELPSNSAPSAAAPEEPKLEEPKPEDDSFSGGLFEKSAAAAMGFGTVEDALSLDEPAQEEPAPEKQEADKPQSLDSAFADIFGEDELPEELPPAQPAGEVEAAPAETASAEDSLDLPEDLSLEAEEKPAELSDTFDISNWSPDAKPAEESLELPAEEPALEMPAEEPAEESLELPAEEPSLEMPAEEPAEESLELPAEEPALEMPAEEPAEESLEPAAEEPTLDEPVLETPAEETPVEEPVQEQPVEETPAEPAVAEEAPAEPAVEDDGFSVDKAFDALFAEEDELPEEKPATASAEPEITDNVSDAPAEEIPASAEESAAVAEDLDKEVGAAISSLFAEDDDLPVEESKTETAAAEEPTPEDTGAEIEEAPLADAALESDLDKSFSSLFGEDDSLNESDLKPASETPAEEPASETAALDDATAAEVNHADADSFESEFSGAFKQLFNTDDDSLDEKADLPSNKGVDFLMSGDSDDEVTARLVSDPNASLDKLPSDLDDSLNTPTLAEIYFEQGLYKKALDIYQDLAHKDPENETIAKRLAEVEAAYRSKSGGENG